MSLRFPKPDKRAKAQKPLKRGSRPRKKRKGATAAMCYEADKLWSLIVRDRASCESPRPHVCRGVYQGAHGFGRSYWSTRWLPINGFKLCQGEHVYFTHRPLEWDEYLKQAWGEDVYWELRRVALGVQKVDVAAALVSLQEEAAKRSLFLPTRAKSSKRIVGSPNYKLVEEGNK